MKGTDRASLCFGALREHRMRSALSIVGIAIGVGSVILLTSIGQGARLYVANELQQFGTNILQITPGKTETFGIPGVMGGTTHKLTIDDAEALRRVPGVEAIVPAVIGLARVVAGERGRDVYVYGVNDEAPEIWKVRARQGSFLPAGDPRRGSQVAVLGPKLKRELFGERNAIGSWVRAAGLRLRVIGVMEPKGRVLGFDMDDCAYVPVATAMGMFNVDELHEVDVTFAEESRPATVVEGVRRTLMDRHGGTEDFTVITQAAMLGVFDRIMNMITAGVAAIAAVSLLVGAVGILTVMWISVGERTHEIGLTRAIGATARQVRGLFLLEAVALSTAGGVIGLAGALALAHAAHWLLPGLAVATPPIVVALALAVTSIAGLASGIAPAQRAARLDPVDALRAE